MSFPNSSLSDFFTPIWDQVFIEFSRISHFNTIFHCSRFIIVLIINYIRKYVYSGYVIICDGMAHIIHIYSMYYMGHFITIRQMVPTTQLPLNHDDTKFENPEIIYTYLLSCEARNAKHKHYTIAKRIL